MNVSTPSENLTTYEGDIVFDLENNLSLEADEEVSGTPEVPEEKGTEEEEIDVPEESEDSEEVSEDDKEDKKYDQLHVALIDVIAEKFDLLAEGKLTNTELKAWLDRNPVFHETANKSRRVKHLYRAFMETQPQEQPPQPDNISVLVADLVQKELARLGQEKSTKVLQSETDSFAESKGLKGESYELFKTTVQALLGVHKTMDRAQLLDMAYRAVVPLKPQGVKVAGGASVPPQTEQKQDLSLGVEILSL